MSRLLCRIAVLGFALSSTPSLGQDEAELPTREIPDAEGASPTIDGQGGMTGSEMKEMSTAVTSMARMCETMMQKEMAGMPLKMAALAILGGMATLALLLFVVLEIQWIRFFNIRIQTERLKAQAAKG